MISNIKSGAAPFSIACKNWSSNNLQSDGLNLQVVSNKGIPQVTFMLDTSINFEEKESEAFKDAVKLQKNIEQFKNLSFTEQSIIMGVFNKLNSLSNADKAEFKLEIKLDKEGSKKEFKVFLNFQANKLKLTKA